MTRIDFYILPHDDEAQRLEFTCRLVDKATQRGNRVLLNCESDSSCTELDTLLWAFRPESYIPHVTLPDDEPKVSAAPVALTCGGDSPSHHEVLVNLDNSLPEHFARFQRLAQIVNQDKNRITASRKLFAFLRDQGYPIEVHNL